MPSAKTYGFRFTEQTNQRLEELAQITGATRTQVLTDLINGEYDKIMGHPEYKAVFEQMKKLQEMLNAANGGK